MTHALICDATTDGRGHGLRCSLNDGHRGPHRDDRYGETWSEK